MSVREDGERTGKFRRGVQDITGIHVACLVDELTLFPIEGQKVCVADVGGHCTVGLTTGCFASSFARLGGQCSPEARDEALHGFAGVRRSLT